MTAKNKPNEIHVSRIYDAPVKRVWEAWTDPEKVGHWYGPRGYSIKTHAMDVRTGGAWTYTMSGPEGASYENKIKFIEIEKYARMVYDHCGLDDKVPALFRVTLTFTEIGGKTKTEMTFALPTAEAAVETKKRIKQTGGDSTWDRLAEYLSPKDRFFINRSFDVPRALMFDVWTKAEHFEKWLPPAGFTMEFIRADIRTGGGTFYCMSGPGGMKMYGKADYKEITKPDRIVYTQYFCDENGKVTRHPMSPTWPETMLTTVTLTEEGADRTRVTIQWEVYGDASAAEHETFNKAKASMNQGWGGSFEKLEGYLTEIAGRSIG